MQTIIYLVRHGQDTDNVEHILNGHRDTELTALGVEQAQQAAQELQSSGISQIYSSPLQRTMTTARIIATALQLSAPTPEPLAIERDFGQLTGRSVLDIATHSAETYQADRVLYFLSGEGVESFEATYTRAQALLDKLNRAHPAGAIALVSHGDFGMMFRAAYYGWSWRAGLDHPYIANGSVLKLEME